LDYLQAHTNLIIQHTLTDRKSTLVGSAEYTSLFGN
jgi:hypothetical protein